MTAPAPEALEDAARRIERWLLDSGIQLADGPQRGGVAGWLDADGRAEFVYLEITGYYLTAMAWLIAGGARAPESPARARERGRAALAWMGEALAGGATPPTRLYLDGEHDDWRNDATFSFDLAMAARGVAGYAAVAGDEDGAAATLVDALVGRLDAVTGEGTELASHRARAGATLPERWSTRPGPHHLKAAAAILCLPAGAVGAALERACQTTMARRTADLRTAWPVEELHPILYGLEGLVLSPSEPAPALAGAAFGRLLALRRPDGSLPTSLSDPATRSDVLAQALRMGALLAAGGRVDDAWAPAGDALAKELLAHQRPDGAMRFAVDQDRANAWCAMFAHQALVLHGARAGGERIAASARTHLV